MDSSALQPYINLLPFAVVAFFSSLLLTPLIGYIANRFKFLDIPASFRQRTDATKEQRISNDVKPRLGGLAVIIPFVLITITHLELTPQIVGLYIGLLIITVLGIIDDKYELSGKVQFIVQLIAASVIVISGTKIVFIDFAGLNIDLASFTQNIQIAGLTYNFIFPADFLTILWIMTIMNALNWVCGIDALGEGMTLIAAITTTLISVKTGNVAIAILPAMLAASLLGFIPFNFPPSKIIGGTVGHTGYGFLLSVLAIMSGAKISSAIILLSIPLVDMIWVLIYRMRTYKTINIFKLLSVSGRVHLHHRLMALGLSAKQTLYIEITAMAFVSIAAIYFGGFNTALISSVIVISIILLVFTIMSLRSRKKKPKAKDPRKDKNRDGDGNDTGTFITPEEKYAY